MLKSKSKLKYVPFILALTFITPVSGIISLQPLTVFAGDATGVTTSIADILKNQRADGGWIKYYDQTSGDWGKSTIDNKATYTEIRRLAAEYTKTKNTIYSAAAIKGINFLINMQYSNGGWPQIYQSTGYHTHITYNDNAMVSVMALLDEVSNKKGDFSFVDSTLANRSKISVQKGIDCILKTQVNANGKLTAWGQQHDEVTLKPAGARAYELPSLCSGESVGIINFLKTRPTTPAIATSIKAAEDWFKTVAIRGIKIVKTSSDVVVVKDASVTTPIWARFYEIGTNRPIFVGRDGIMKYALADIDVERRTGYAWYGNWGSKISTTPVPTAAPTPVPTATPVVTPKPTATPVATPKPTATPVATPKPTATPVATPKPTATPVATPKPTATPVATPKPIVTGNIQVKMFNGTIAASTNTISPKFILTNTGSSAIDLSTVKIRYYYTIDGEQTQSFWCDWSTIEASNVTSKMVKMTTPKTNADYYLEVGFTSVAGSLKPGSSVEIQGRMAKANWSNYTQTNDYSYNSTATSYAASNKVTVFIANSLSFGIQP